ncbi:hypothetical protein SUDANB126_00074 [Streptomyces sp. enrichment culture]
MVLWVRETVKSWLRPGSAGETHGTSPSGSVSTWMSTPWRRCLAEQSVRLSDAVALGEGAVQKDGLGIVFAQHLEKTRGSVGEQAGHGGDSVGQPAGVLD